MALTLQDIGWNEDFAEAFRNAAKPGWIPGRLSRETKINYTALLDGGDELDVVLGGRLWHEAQTDAELPAVGDWVAIDPGRPGDEAVIRALLPRKTCFSRKEPGKSSAEQVLAANVDIVVVVTDPGPDFNPRRMERYFALIRKSGAKPVVLVNKVDDYPSDAVDTAIEEISLLEPLADILPVSALKHTGLAALKGYLTPGTTLAVVGSSGVGKSTLVNSLLGDEWLWTGDVNEVTGKGRHTTVARELVVLPDGGVLIDNPGMREIQMWTDEHTLRESFADLTELAQRCRFADCSHRHDHGCAVRDALQAGSLTGERYESFMNLEREIEELVKRQKKRRINMERAGKRDVKVKARNYEDRRELERDRHPHRYRGEQE